jgi:hypothetical protein
MEKPVITGISYAYNLSKGFEFLSMRLFLGAKVASLFERIKNEFDSLDNLLTEQFGACKKEDIGKIASGGSTTSVRAGYAYKDNDNLRVCDLEFVLNYYPDEQIKLCCYFSPECENTIWAIYDELISRYELHGETKSRAQQIEYLRKNKGTITPQTLLGGKDNEVLITAISKV